MPDFLCSAASRQKVQIAPSLLSADFTRLREDLERLEGEPDLYHLDILDGHFVPNISYGPGIVKQIRKLSDKPLDAHLMVSEPERWISPFLDAGVDLISFHLEATPHPHRLIQQIKAAGCRVGIAINPGTSELLLEPLLEELDLVLVMSVNPGFGGQSYLPLVEKKLAHLRCLASEQDLPFALEVDGGIKRATIGAATRAGARIFVAGSAVFAAENPAAEIRELRKLALSSTAEYV